jgi:hypothetical protein
MMSPRPRSAVAWFALLPALLLCVGSGSCTPPAPPPDTSGQSSGATRVAPKIPALPDPPPALDLSPKNRREPTPGLPDWSKAGYREGMALPGESEMTDSAECVLEPDTLADDYRVRPDDGVDDSRGLQKAIDFVRETCTPTASYDELSLLELPAGDLDVSRQITVDADFLVIRGSGSDVSGGTRLVFRPDADTRYDALTDEGGDWDEDGMSYESGNGGWIWPGRGLFRVQSRDVDEDYLEDYESAPANRKDLFEGTVNVHWKAGERLAEKPGEPGFAARTGDTVIHLDGRPDKEVFAPGRYVNIRAANTMRFYRGQHALPTDHDLQNLHMRQQIFRIVDVDEDARTLTIDKPLEFDVPVDSISDGSEAIDADTYDSKASPMVDPVEGVGFENLLITQVLDDHDPKEADHNYGNISPADALHGIVFKWAVNGWVRGITTYMTGSHPVVTEEAKNLQIEGNRFLGAWNKGKGGNGYLRGARVWDSVYAGNLLRGLRHFTFQWSASDNVFIGNDTDSDINLHGGWERRNLVELNTSRVPFEHRPGNCSANCGGEGGDTEDESTWYPIWWAAGQKAVKWSGATGPQNVFFNNTLAKQEDSGGESVPYYSDSGSANHVVYQFGWDGRAYHHLSDDGEPISDWAENEKLDYTGGNGVDTTLRVDVASLFLHETGRSISN